MFVSFHFKLEHLNGNNAVQIKTEVRTEDVIFNNEDDHFDFEEEDEFSESHNSSSGQQRVQDILRSGYHSCYTLSVWKDN